MKTSEAQKKATIKYMKEKRTRIPFDLANDEAEELKTFVKSQGMTMRQFLLDAIQEKRARMN